MSDESDPRRGEKLQQILDRKGAEISKVMRKLLDAYIAADGNIDFPAKMVAMTAEEAAEYRTRSTGLDGERGHVIVDPLSVEERGRLAARGKSSARSKQRA